MKLSSGDALAKLKALDLAGAEPAQNALAEEKADSPGPQPRHIRKVSRDVKTRSKPTASQSSYRRSHSKGDAAAIVTGYLDPLHVEVLLDLRSRFGSSALSAPSVNLLLKVALRLIKVLKPTDEQILDAFLKEKEGEG
jgi:hypothetical protein